jgi:cytidylate kinase
MAIHKQQDEALGASAARFQERAQRAREERTSGIEAFPRIITISREFGAGGSDIAGHVAAELGFQLWDHELISYLARKAQADVQLIRELDERQRDLIDDVLTTSIHGGRISGGKYRVLLTRTIAELAERGGAVIVGRGANFLVPAEQALRVRVVCPFKQRVERYGEREHVDWARAACLVRSKDRERERFVRQLSGESSADPSHYDIVVSTYDLSERDAASLVIAAYQARFGLKCAPRMQEGREARS